MAMLALFRWKESRTRGRTQDLRLNREIGLFLDGPHTVTQSGHEYSTHTKFGRREIFESQPSPRFPHRQHVPIIALASGEEFITFEY